MIIECAGYSHEFDDKELDKWADRCRRVRLSAPRPLAWARLTKSDKTYWRAAARSAVWAHLLHLRYYPPKDASAVEATRGFMNKELGPA